MAIEADLRTYLISKAAITNIVGAGTAARIYPHKAPQAAAFPHITYTQISNEHIRANGGSLGLARPTFQISVWGTTYTSIQSLADAIRVSMDGANTTFGSTRVRSAFLETEIDLYEPPQRADDVGVYHRAMDWTLTHAESVPTL